MLEKLELLREVMHRYDYTQFISGSPRERINAITGGMDFILGLSEEAQKESYEDEYDKNPIYPYYLVYVSEDGELLYSYTNIKKY